MRRRSASLTRRRVARMRSARLFRWSWKVPRRDRPQMWVNPRKQNASGLPSPRWARRSAAERPNAIRRVSAAQGGMVGNREIETQQANDRADQPFGLAQSQTEHGLEGQGRRDRQIRVVRLTAWRGARLRVPGRDRLFREPDRQAPTLAQGGIILGPVRDPAPLLRDMMPAISIGLERHGGSRVTEGVVHLRQLSLHANRPIRATNSEIGLKADSFLPGQYVHSSTNDLHSRSIVSAFAYTH